MNKYVMASVGSLSVIAVAAAHVDFVQHPLSADVEAAAIVLASSSTSAQIVVAHSVLDGVEYVVIPPGVCSSSSSLSLGPASLS